MVNKVRTIDFLPEIFRTDYNRQFLDASLDILTSQPNLNRVEGFIGTKYGYGVAPTDKYVVEPSKTRSDYQLEPSVVFLKPETQTAQDFISYTGIVQALKNEGSITNNQDRMFSAEFYSWDPFIDLDKAVNYSQYFWIPFGPDAVLLSTTDVLDILDEVTYTDSNGITLTNGLKVLFTDTVVPAVYANKQYYVEGVGTSIKLLPVSNFVAAEESSQSVYDAWDFYPFDSIAYSEELYVPVTPEYLTISRNSRDYNAWTRANRWFHKNVLDLTASVNGAVTTRSSNTPSRAQRPILEFQGNLQLFNSGTSYLGKVDFIDTTRLDVFGPVVPVINPNPIEGQPITNVSSIFIDGVQIFEGATIVFAADINPLIRQNVYKVTFTPSGISLIPLVTAIDQSQVCVLLGNTQAGTTWRYDGTITSWIACQLKTQVNQAPKFDVFNKNGTSFGNLEVYPLSSFKGCDLFSYTPGTGSADPILGFPISYSELTNIGDINFTVNLNSDTFTYSDAASNSYITESVSTGYVYYYPELDVTERRIGWVPAVAPSRQSQVFEFPVTSLTQSSFTCDIPAELSSPALQWSAVQVYRDDQILDKDQYNFIVDNVLGTTNVTLTNTAEYGEKITILILSDQVSKTAYYEYPANLESNPFNANITSVDVGDLRNQYRRVYTNAQTDKNITGDIFGDNNIHDLGNLKGYNDAIIQNSSSLVLPGVFTRKLQYNLMDSLQYNSREYINYKTLLISLTNAGDYSVYQSPSDILDNVINQISDIKNNTSPFFWSDMLCSGSPYAVNEYSFGAETSLVEVPLSRTYDFTSANYYGLMLYAVKVINGIVNYIQLIKDVDYVVSETQPKVTVTYTFQEGNGLVVKEYNQTYGNYCPNTPTKIGLYPKFIPEVVLDDTYTTPTYFIKGHDGSYNKLYGDYDPVTGLLNDFRDQVLFEFELRVFNNIKVTGVIPLTEDDVVPGEWRTTDYTWQEILSMYSTQFLNWVGENRIDYKRQIYNSGNSFTFNYNQSADKLTQDQLLQGYWRGIYNWLYDTDNPAQAPWQMLGLVNEPSWWTERYGAAPYTSGNAYMWTEISEGFVWNDGASYVNENYIRPGLLQALPVDAVGNLLSPFDSIVGNYTTLSFNRDWVVGDGAPAEASYKKSSTWPFDLMRLLALTKPAKFYNLNVDRDLYKYNVEFEQYLYDQRSHLDPRTVQVYGNGTAKHSYLNWIVDYVNQRGVDGTTAVTSLLNNLDVRLTYNLAGFSAKNYLKFLVEKATNNSRNTSLLIPDDSYSVLLYDNVPQERITYSSVIIQKTQHGWKVWGNSQNKPYFTTVAPKLSGRYQIITAGDSSVKLTTEWYSDRNQFVPYGTEFFSKQSISEFLIDYGRYLTEQGVVFANVENGVEYNWTRMIQEFLVWDNQQWEIGSTISLNPDARLFTVDKPDLVVQPLTIQQQNFVLNQNLVPLQSQTNVVLRENTSFTVKIISEGDTVAYTNLNLASIEHAVVFDNTTVFNDLIYNLTTGLRQTRLLLKGYKTADWHGYMSAEGFILNEDNIQEWQPNVKYTKDKIVLYKTSYWSANKLIAPASEFKKEDWRQVNYDTIKSGLLPNPSTMAYESLYYYDSNRANLENDADLLSFSLIGFRPRDYLAAADLSDITQVNVYKNIVREKGTNLIANSFKTATFMQGAIDYEVQENWAIRNGIFGSILNSNFVEAELIQSELTGNPTLLGFSQTGSVDGVQQSVQLNQLVNYGKQPSTPNFLPLSENSYTTQTGLPSAGYVNINDTKFSEYYYDNLNLNSANISNIYRGDNVWIANYKGSWDVFTPVSVNTQVTQALISQNGEITFTFAGPHGLVKDDLFAIINFNENLNRFYRVKSSKTLNTVTVSFILPNIAVNPIIGLGVAFKLVSQRTYQASDLASSFISGNEFYTQRHWVDYDVDTQWSVWASSPVFQSSPLTVASSANLGTGVAYTTIIGTLVGDSTTNTVLRINANFPQTLTGSVGFGKAIKAVGTRAYIASDANVYVYDIDEFHKLSLVQTISVSNTGGIAISNDYSWLYISDASTSAIYVYFYDTDAELYQLANTLMGPSGVAWATSIATSTDGVKLVVGAPNTTVNSLINAGAAYVYTRGLERFLADGTLTSFNTSNFIPNNKANVYVNSILTTVGVTVSGISVSFADPPIDGSIITVAYGTLNPVAYLESETPFLGGSYGQSVDTNRYGAEILIGAPYEINTIGSSVNVEGAVYRYTNSGQRYGSIVGIAPSVSVYDIVFIDGYQVTFTTTTTLPSIIAADINTQTPTNIIATGNDDDLTLTIAVLDGTVETIYNIIDLTASVSVIEALGINLYTNTQILTNPNENKVSEFGYSVKMNEQDSLIVSAPVVDRISPCQFDYTTDSLQNDTLFDNDATVFIDSFANSGMVYEFDYLPASSENINNPGKYAFGQYIATSDLTGIALQPKFGLNLSYSDSVILIGSPNWYANGNGLVKMFVPGYVPDYLPDTIKTTSWFLDKKPIATVDINRVKNIQIYNGYDNTTLSYLDYIDPEQNKLLGAVTTNLDYASPADPACYTNEALTWGELQVGKTWLDTNSIRIMNYHQPDVAYNSRYWARAFPGSTATVYTWVESSAIPINYNGSGTVLSTNQYVTVTKLNRATDSLVSTYYFWVRDYDVIPKGKTLSPLVVTQYLLNPLSSGIAFLAPITTNIVGLYNCSEYIQDVTSILHIGYSAGVNQDQAHESWLLVKEGVSSSFLTGLPTIIQPNPTSLYLKLLDSFCGQDTLGSPVPDPKLPILAKYGVSNRPRQSMFIDRLLALENYIDYANNILITLPITEMRSLGFLETVGPWADPLDYSYGRTYDTTLYWKRVNWWATGYSDNTKIIVEVATYSDLLKIQQRQLQVGVNGNVFIADGFVARVKNGGLKPSETYVWYTATGWTRIGLTNGTIQILPKLWQQLVGWSSNVWDSAIWDSDIAVETRYIIRWLNEQCYINDLTIERNRSLILMFKYIQSESLQQSNYLPWLNKTSLIDVNHRIRELLPYKKFQRDNQEFLSGYLNEVKPFHVYIKNFIYSYKGIDTFYGNLTDFDLPAKYNADVGEFVSPRLVYDNVDEIGEYLPDADIWQDREYNEWRSNYGLSFESGRGVVDITYLTATITAIEPSIPVFSAYGLPESGIITIDQEEISYTSVDRLNNILLGVLRGINNTTPVEHAIDTSVMYSPPPLMVIDQGRGYVAVPTVTAEIDTGFYTGFPTQPAVFKANLSSGKVTDIIVEDAGKGYPVGADIVITPSPIASSFSTGAVNILLNSITITSHPFQTGDCVVYTGSSGPAGLISGSYYYIRSINANSIAIYTSYKNAVNTAYVYRHKADFDGRVALISTGTSVNTFAVTARAIAFNVGTPVRELRVTMKFDRISYGLQDGWDVDNWDMQLWDEDIPSAARTIYDSYRPTPNMLGRDFAQLMTGMEYPNPIFLGKTFTSLAEIDTQLMSPDFLYNPNTSPTTYNVQGGEFTDGYSPEEFVAGYVTDLLNLTVTSDDADLSFRLTVDRYGATAVYNTNPYTQTTLSQAFTSTNTLADVLHVTDASKLVEQSITNTVTSGTGKVVISGVKSIKIMSVSINLPNAFTWQAYGVNAIEISIPTAPTTVVQVTVVYGNVLLLNSEFIGFTEIDLTANTVSGLRRGLLGSITNQYVGNGSVVQSVQNRDNLSENVVGAIDNWWYGAPSSPTSNTTLAANSSTYAVFLQNTTP